MLGDGIVKDCGGVDILHFGKFEIQAVLNVVNAIYLMFILAPRFLVLILVGAAETVDLYLKKKNHRKHEDRV